MKVVVSQSLQAVMQAYFAKRISDARAIWDTVANLGLFASGPLCWGEQTVVPANLRFAAGVCVLAAGLLMGGGTVAVADPGLDIPGS